MKFCSEILLPKKKINKNAIENSKKILKNTLERIVYIEKYKRFDFSKKY